MALLIALEGIDGAGTTTQASRLVAWLRARGHEAEETREPSDGSVGRLLREVLAGRRSSSPQLVALLFAADRLDHLESVIEPARRACRHVVTDRYVLSSLAYQSLDCDPHWVADLNRFAPPADLTFLLEVRAEVAEARRMAAGRASERFDALDLQHRVAAAYRRLAHSHGAIVLDGEATPNEVHAAITGHVLHRL